MKDPFPPDDFPGKNLFAFPGLNCPKSVSDAVVAEGGHWLFTSSTFLAMLQFKYSIPSSLLLDSADSLSQVYSRV